jgi:nitrate reductase gamma subunit
MNFLLFEIYPYIALTVLALGSIARYERDPFTWKSSSSQLLRRKQLVLGSVLFHVGVLVIFVGHLAGLLTPLWFFELVGISHGFKQVLAIVVGGAGAVVALIGGGMLLHRRLTDPRIRATSSFADIGILVLLLLQLVLGMLTILVSLQHLDGGEMVKFMAWAQGIFLFRTDAWLNVEGANILFKLHIFLGLTILLLFPFTRLVHMLSVPIRYLWRPGYQIVRTRRAGASAVARPAAAHQPTPAPSPTPTLAARPRPAE